jgi:valyl-tRNA synthetase
MTAACKTTPRQLCRRLSALQPARPLDRLAAAKVEAEVAKGFAEFRLDNVANTIYDFVWNEFCDWYLEIAKVQIQTGNEAQQRATRRTLIRTLEAIAPGPPHHPVRHRSPVAEGGARGRPRRRLDRRGRYPEAQPEKIDEAAIAYVARIKQMVDACRALRGEMGVSPAQRLPLLTVAGSADGAAFLRANADVLKNLAKLSEVKVFDDEAAWATEAQNAPVSVVGDARLALFVEIDVAAEKARLSKEASAWKARSPRPTASWATKPSAPRRPPPCWSRSASAWPTLAPR